MSSEWIVEFLTGDRKRDRYILIHSPFRTSLVFFSRELLWLIFSRFFLRFRQKNKNVTRCTTDNTVSHYKYLQILVNHTKDVGGQKGILDTHHLTRVHTPNNGWKKTKISAFNSSTTILHRPSIPDNKLCPIPYALLLALLHFSSVWSLSCQLRFAIWNLLSMVGYWYLIT